MKLQTLSRAGISAVAVLALSAGLAACGDDDNDGKASGGNDGATTSMSDNGASDGADDGASDAGAQTFGPGCKSIPQDGAGSFNGMVQDAVGTAAGNNPLLTKLVAAVGAVGLGDTLNDPDAAYTVFAPYDPAFEALDKKTVDGLVAGAKAGPSSPLGKILLHHVLGENDDPAAVVGEHTTANGDTITVEGDEDGMTVSDGTVTANVLCGNIPTANATVYVIDSVLVGADVD